MTTDTVWLSCGVLRAEMEALHQRGLIKGKLLFLDSMLHMDPPALEATLTRLLEKDADTPRCLVLAYGDCCSRMLDLVRRFRVGRVNAINCAQLLLGRDRYRQLMHQEAFLVLPEWAGRWEEIMQHELGLTRTVAHDLMRETRSVLVYLDTGLAPVPAQEMAAFSAYSGLPWQVEVVNLEIMLSQLLAAQNEAQTNPLVEVNFP